MKQLIIIHGWSSFPDNDTFCKALEKWEYRLEERKDRKDRLGPKLKGEYQTFNPKMPNKNNATYKARKIRFEKIFPYLNDEDLVIIGNSLWGMFIMKYLCENGFPKKIKKLYLVAAVIDDSHADSAQDKYCWDFAFDVDSIPKVEQFADEIYIYHSIDDPSAPYIQAEKIKSYLPKTKLITFTDRGHFLQPEFPELLENILHG